MPLPLETVIEPVVPNTFKYILSIAPRISEGQLLAAISVVLQPCRCDIADGVETWTECFAESKVISIPDLMGYAAEHPELAAVIGNAWNAINAAVAAINAQDKVL